MNWRIITTLILSILVPFTAAALARPDRYQAKEMFLFTFAPVIAVGLGIVGGLLCRKHFWVAGVGTFLGIMLTSLTLLSDAQWEPGQHLFGSILAAGVLGIVALTTGALTFGGLTLFGLHSKPARS